MQLQKLMQKIEKFHSSDRLELVRKAYQFAKEAHEGQRRRSGDPYFVHPYRVAVILADLMLDATTISAGLLHDVVEDTDVTIDDLTQVFGSEVATLVDGVTKLTKLDFSDKEEQKVESIRKMFLAMAKDMRVVLIKLADRLHNMRTMKHQSTARQEAIARETLDIYAPLAHRLGVFTIKWELEDLSLCYLHPDIYYDLVEKVGMKRQEREKAITSVIKILQERLEQENIQCEIKGRPKHFYSIYKKMYVQKKPFEEIYDLIAIRVTVENVQDCYAVLGVVHTLWKTVPNRYKDYISMPKPNMYQSLHTTVVGNGGMPFEVQIRTWQMHRTAEYGIAAHWRYKEGKQAADELDDKLRWVRQLANWESEMKESTEFLELLKVDMFADTVVVFTPKGSVIDLPIGSTPIDFAYRIHSAVGNKCVGAKINNRMVPLETKLKTGDFCEILTSAASNGPSKDWERIAITSQAKNKIRQWFRHEGRDANVALGRELLEKEARRQNIDTSALLSHDFLETVYKRYGFSSIQDLYAALGFGTVTTAQILVRLHEEQKKQEKPDLFALAPTEPVKAKKRSGQGIYVAGQSDMQYHCARCCNPVKGDEIVGFVTRGRGVSVHRADCKNVTDIEVERRIDVSWEDHSKQTYDVQIAIVAYDRAGLLSDLATLVAALEVPIVAISARTGANRQSTINLTMEIRDTEQLRKVLGSFENRPDIIEVYRVGA